MIVATETMTNERRSLLLKIWAGHAPIHDITFPLFQLNANFPKRALDDALRVLVKRGIVGMNFVVWFNVDCKKSYLEMHRKLVSMLEKAPVRALVAGKDGFTE